MSAIDDITGRLMLEFQQQFYACEDERRALSGILRDRVWLALFHDPWAHYGSEPAVIAVCLSADQAELAARRHVRVVAGARSPGAFDGAAYVLQTWAWTGERFDAAEERHICLLADGEDCPPRPPAKLTDAALYMESGNPEDWT